jgi:osmotically-inducible protein OsmY
LNDRELKLSIVDNLKNDGRLDLEQLEISCRKGVGYLEGIIPSEIEHQILLRTLTDVMGFSSLIDRIQINEPDWQRNDGVQCGELDDVSAQRPHPIT